jgi:hypothetical protein
MISDQYRHPPPAICHLPKISGLFRSEFPICSDMWESGARSLAELRQIATWMHAESPWLTTFVHWRNGAIFLALSFRYGGRGQVSEVQGLIESITAMEVSLELWMSSISLMPKDPRRGHGKWQWCGNGATCGEPRSRAIADSHRPAGPAQNGLPLAVECEP